MSGTEEKFLSLFSPSTEDAAVAMPFNAFYGFLEARLRGVIGFVRLRRYLGF
jgi:hypothetical protein